MTNIDTVQAHVALVLEGVMLTQNGMEVHDVFTFTSLSPIKVEVKTLEEIGWKEEKTVLNKTVAGIGGKYVLSLTSDTPIINAGRNGNKVDVKRFDGGVKVISPYAEVLDFAPLMPMVNARELFGPDAPLTVKQSKLTAILDDGLAFDEKRRQFLEAHGVTPPSDGDYERTKEQVAALRKIAEKADSGGSPLMAVAEARNLLKSLKGGTEMAGELASDEVISMDQMRFATSDATDFHNVSMQCDDHYHDSNLLRVVHTSPPEWREPTDDMKAKGFIGYWHFDKAAVVMPGGKQGLPEGMGVEAPKGVEVNMAYATREDLNLAVKTHDSINPAGTAAIPEMLFRILSGRDPLTTMSCEEGDAYNKDKLMPWPQAVATAIADHTLATVKGSKPPKRKSN